jgi:hypothetical protein
MTRAALVKGGGETFGFVFRFCIKILIIVHMILLVLFIVVIVGFVQFKPRLLKILDPIGTEILTSMKAPISEMISDAVAAGLTAPPPS